MQVPGWAHSREPVKWGGKREANTLHGDMGGLVRGGAGAHACLVRDKRLGKRHKSRIEKPEHDKHGHHKTLCLVGQECFRAFTSERCRGKQCRDKEEEAHEVRLLQR